MRGAVLAAVCVGLLALAAPASAARLVTWTTKSRYVDPATVGFNGASHPRELRVDVLLPDGYDGRRRFPVLYLLHGHGDAYDSWARAANGDIVRLAKGFQAVIVMPEADRGWYANWWNGGKRGHPAWERYHLDELLPLVERRLRIRRGRRWHAIAGLSMGAEGAVYYASQRPGYFGAAAAFSPPLSIQRPEWPASFDTQGEKHLQVFGDPDAQAFYWTGHNPTALVGNLRYTRLFVAVGDGVPGNLQEAGNTFGSLAELELRQHAQDFVTAARGAGIDVTYRPQQGIHAWPYWRRHLGQAIGWGFFRPVEAAPTEWSFRTVAQSGDAWGLRFSFARPPAALETLSRHGATISGAGSGAVAVRTSQGCRLSLTLPFSRALPPGCRIRLAVAPRSAPVGRPTRFRFRVRAGGRPLRGARIRFAGRRARTGRTGRAAIVLELRRAGRYRVRASRPGFRSATATVRAR